MVDNLQDIKNYISERNSENSCWNIRGIIRMKDRYKQYVKPDEDIFNMFIDLASDLTYDKFKPYTDEYKDIRIYFDPNPVKKSRISEKLINGPIKKLSQFEDYISYFPKIILDIDSNDSDFTENIRRETKEYTDILLDIPTVYGRHLVTEYPRKQIDYYNFKFKIESFKKVTFKYNYNLTLLCTLL